MKEEQIQKSYDDGRFFGVVMGGRVHTPFGE